MEDEKTNPDVRTHLQPLGTLVKSEHRAELHRLEAWESLYCPELGSVQDGGADLDLTRVFWLLRRSRTVGRERCEGRRLLFHAKTWQKKNGVTLGTDTQHFSHER